MIAVVRTSLSSLLLAVLLAASSGAQQPKQTTAPEDAAAVIGDRRFTTREIDERWKASSPVQQAQAAQALYDGRREALDALIADFLLDKAARAKRMPRAEFETAEIERRMRPVTQADIAEYYRANRSLVEGRSLPEMSTLLRELLEEESRTAALAAVIADLKAAEPTLRVMLEAPRQAIELGPDDTADGPANAPVTVVEFADFQCPFCQKLQPTLRQIREHYGDRVRIVWKDFPLTRIHPQAFHAAEAANCAHEQGRFWEYHDRLFVSQQTLNDAALRLYARDAHLDGPRFDACLDSSKYRRRVEDAISAAARLGLSSTPTTFVNGRMIAGARAYEVFAAVIDDELASGPLP